MITGTERNRQSLNMIFNSREIKSEHIEGFLIDYNNPEADNYIKELNDYCYSHQIQLQVNEFKQYIDITLDNQTFEERMEVEKLISKYANILKSEYLAGGGRWFRTVLKDTIVNSRRPIKSSVRMIRHPSVETYLPFTQYNGSPYNFNGIQINDWGVRLEGSAGGPYAAESTNIDVYNDGTVSVYDTKHHLDHTEFYDLKLIRDFIRFFRENVDVMFYLDKPTNTGMVSLSSTDTRKIKEWADTHEFNE